MKMHETHFICKNDHSYFYTDLATMGFVNICFGRRVVFI